MPIRLNLLAEAQAAEEMRRKDPVKRNIWLAGFAVFCMLAWYGTMFAGHLNRKSELTRIEGNYSPLTKPEAEVRGQLGRIAEISGKLEKLNEFAASRFLWASMLHSLQEVHIEDVTIISVKTEQKYDVDIPVSSPGSKTPPKTLPSSTEKISVLIGAKNYKIENNNPTKYRDAIANHPFFKKHMELTEGATAGEETGVKVQGILSPVGTDPNGDTYRPFRVLITFPERLRR